MNLNHLLLATFVMCSVFANAQFKRSYNHYYQTSNIHQSFVLEYDSQNLDLVRAELDSNSNLFITTNTIDIHGDIQSSVQFNFGVSPLTAVTPLITGIFDSGNERTVMMELLSTTTMNFFVIKYNKVTGVELGSHLDTEVYRASFVNSILNNNEIVNYAVKVSGGLYRTTFNLTNISSVNEESVDPALANFGGGANISQGKDAGKVMLFNGNEVSSFVNGTKQLFERTAANSYSIHPLNTNSSGQVNLTLLPNNNLLVHNNGEFFEVTNSFGIVGSTPVILGSIVYSELGLLNNQIHLFYTQTGQQRVNYKTFDTNLTMTDSVSYSYQRLIDILPFNGGLSLVGSLFGDNQVQALYNGQAFSSAAVTIDYFKTSGNVARVEEFHHNESVHDLTVGFGLGNQFFPMSVDNTSDFRYNDSIGIVYNMANIYTGITSTDTVGQSQSVYQPLFLPGPYTTSGMYTDIISDRYNRGFFVTKAMIENHIDSLQSGSPGYIAPHGIRNWPAHGEVSLGQASALAPFIDINGNNIYEPYQGDYPSIYGDNCFFSITHDNPNTLKTASVETHSFKYWFDCDTSEALHNTIFNKCFYFSRVENFDEFKLGTFGDVDLGNYADDYVGTNVELGMIYQYNADLDDENNSGLVGFKDKCPAVGIIVLKGAPLTSDTLDNPSGTAQDGSYNGYGFGDSQIDNEFFTLEHSMVFMGSGGQPGQTDPQNVMQFDNYLSGLWQFGDQVYWGGTGFPGTAASTIPAKYLYPGISDQLNYGTNGIDPDFDNWSEIEPNGIGSTSNPSGDRRFMGATAPQSLYVGDTVVYDIAFVISNDQTVVTTLDQAPNSLFAKASLVKSAFNQNSGDCEITFNPIDEDLAITAQKINDVLVYPNPTTGSFKIDGLLNPNASIAIFDLEGRLLFEQQNVSAQTEISLDQFNGNIFMIAITDGANKYVKRIVKQ